MSRKYSDVGYLAGLFDAKGSLKIENNSLLVWITTEHFKVMEFLQRFGAFIGKRPDGKFKAKWKDRYAGRILKEMLPHLRVKYEQADLGIEFSESKERGLDPKTYILPLQLRLRLIKKDEPEE